MLPRKLYILKSMTQAVNNLVEKRTGYRIRRIAGFPFMTFDHNRFLAVRLDVINRCNLRCKICFFSQDEVRNAPLSHMSRELFQKIAHEIFPLTRQLIFSAGAEPLMSNHFGKMLEMTRQYHIPYISFFTNGALLNETLARQFIRLPVNEIHFSVDGATKETYEAIRIGGNFDQLLANIRTLHDLKMAQNSSVPRLSFQIVVMRSNIHELSACVELAHTLGIENINVSVLIPHQGLSLEKEVLDSHSAAVRSSVLKASLLAKQHQINFVFPAHIFDADTKKQHVSQGQSQCQSPWQEIFIKSDGTAYPCCFWGNPPMGNLVQQTFQEIWSGQSYEQLRQEILSGKLSVNCVQCPIFGIKQYDNKITPHCDN